jgi:flagellin
LNRAFAVSLNSVNTNVGAMQALQSLNAINARLQQTQNRISTGLKVASAKDNPAIWAIAQNQRAESRALNAVMNSLQRGQSVVEVALSAGESISDILLQMKEKMLAASEPGITADSRTALNADYVALRRLIDTTADNASFNGINLISSGTVGNVRARANSSATSTIDVDHVDLSASTGALSGLPADLMATITPAMLSGMNSSISSVSSALSRLGTGAKSLERHLTFVEKLQDTIDAGIGNLVDADMAKEAATLQALQVQQQLAIMALGIANRAPSMLLQLFQNLR